MNKRDESGKKLIASLTEEERGKFVTYRKLHDWERQHRLLDLIIKAYKKYYDDQYEYGAEDVFLHRMEKLMADAGVIW